jgi:hypothetical protein
MSIAKSKKLLSREQDFSSLSKMHSQREHNLVQSKHGFKEDSLVTWVGNGRSFKCHSVQLQLRQLRVYLLE